MAQYCINCKSLIEEGANFCKHCGTPVLQPEAQPSPAPPPSPPPQAGWTSLPQPAFPSGEMPPSKIKAAFIGGAISGLLSTVPIVAAGNCFCCMWVVLGGAVAAWIYSKEVPVLDTGTAALVGLLSGVFGAVIHTVLEIPLRFMFGPMQRELLRRVLEQSGGMPREAEQFFEWLTRPGLHFGVIFFGLLFAIVLYSLFGALGGMLGSALLRKKTAA